MTEKVAEYSLRPGDHGATYGGNPLACTAVKTVLGIFERDRIVDHVNEVAPYLVIQAEGNVLRFVPPLIVEEKHIDEMIGKLKKALGA